MTEKHMDFAHLETACHAAAISRLDRLVEASGNPANVARLKPSDLRQALNTVLPAAEDLDAAWVHAMAKDRPDLLDAPVFGGDSVREVILEAVAEMVWQAVYPRLQAEIDSRAAALGSPTLGM